MLAQANVTSYEMAKILRAPQHRREPLVEVVLAGSHFCVRIAADSTTVTSPSESESTRAFTTGCVWPLCRRRLLSLRRLGKEAKASF